MVRPSDLYELTSQQARFCDKYLESGCKSGKNAAVESGYSKVTASRMASKILKKEAAKKYMSKRLQAALDAAGGTFQWKVQKLCLVADVCAPDDAQDKTEINAAGAVSAIAELNRMEGHIAPAKSVNISFTASKEGESIIQTRDRIIEEMRLKHELEY